MSDRLVELQTWLSETIGLPHNGHSADLALRPTAGDASVRRYFRINAAGRRLVIMDAPPHQLDCRPFVAIAERFRNLGLNVPEILAANLEQGFLLLSDLGDRHYLDELNDTSAGPLYRDALAALATIQLRADPLAAELPPYDDALIHRELEIFVDWFLRAYLQLTLNDAEHDILTAAFAALSKVMLEQPRCWVHRDYHSRNLMVTAQQRPGILDFQDGLYGPIGYDLASLLRDCYIAWPPQQVETWALAHFAELQKQGSFDNGSLPDSATLLRWLDFCATQRHLKAAGLFTRLQLRDGKSRYLADLPRTLGYVIAASGRHAELTGLHELLLRVLPPTLRPY